MLLIFFILSKHIKKCLSMAVRIAHNDFQIAFSRILLNGNLFVQDETSLGPIQRNRH